MVLRAKATLVVLDGSTGTGGQLELKSILVPVAVGVDSVGGPMLCGKLRQCR